MNKIQKALKKISLDSLLLLLAEQSRELFLNNTPFKRIEFERKMCGFRQVSGMHLTAWNLADLSYLAIMNTNDYKSLNPTTNDVYQLNNILINENEKISKEKRNSLPEEDKITYMLFGMSQKQFWYQEILQGPHIYYNFLRYYILLHEIPLLLPRHKLPNDDLKEMTGFDINGFLQLMFIGYSILNKNSVVKIKIAADLRDKMPLVTEENLEKCLNMFTGNYTFYRRADFPNNPLYLKPLIRTDRGALIISNAFIWTRKLYEGAYWLIRNKYQTMGSQNFVNKFGEYYERYIEKVLKYYLDSHRYRKVEQDSKKKADWIIETNNYILLIEQKSSLMTIELKSEAPSLELLDKYLKRNFKEAYIQLAETEREINQTQKKALKFILHFETFYLGEAIIKGRIKHIFKEEVHDMSNYFFIETVEFEKLVQLLSEDEKAFNKVIEIKLGYEREYPITEGIEFSSIIDRTKPIKEIKFLERHKQFFDNLLNI